MNFDLAVDSADLGEVIALWAAESPLNADLNDDGIVNGADVAYILGWYGATCDSTNAP